MLPSEIYDPGCTKCKLHRNADRVCSPGFGKRTADIMVIGKMPNSLRYQRQIEDDLKAVGIDPGRVFWASAIKCRNFEDNVSNTDVKACSRAYLDREMAIIGPRYILALGNEALLATTGHSGIMKYRGRPMERGSASANDQATIMATISPSAVLARPQNKPGYEADLRLFANLVNGKETTIRAPKYKTINTMTELKKLKADLDKADLLSFDIESTICDLGEFDEGARIISVAGTYIVGNKIRGFAIPLWHPESPWRDRWRAVIRFLAEAFQRIRKRIAHNGKFDSRWLRRFGMPELDNTFDTMLAVHILDENAIKALKPQAQMRLGVAPWGVDTKNLLNMPIAEVLEYNFLDTWYTYLIYLQLKQELIEQPRLLRLFQLLMMPANSNLIPVEQHGVWRDPDRLREREPIARAELRKIEDQIRSYLPSPDSPEWPTNAKGKPLAINFNASNFARWMLFDYLGLPILERGKEKPDGSPGAPSMAEGILMHLNDVADPHPVIRLMLDRVQWNKWLTGFFEAYRRLADKEDRLRTSFKLYGTVTGRLSSGKDDTDKMSGTTSKVRGWNKQQTPRDPFIRGIIGSTPGFTWAEFDFSQIELRIAAFIANERRMIELYNQGADLHMALAMALSGLPEHMITKEIRKRAKPVNFGYLYDMGWRKFQETAFQNYGVKFSDGQAQADKTAYFNFYPDLHPWHDKQRRLVKKYGRVESPIGRVRHLPDIYSPDPKVRAEAERQAINSPVQGLASDMALAAMNTVSEKLTALKLDKDAFILGLVHDAINLEIRDDRVGDVLPIVKEAMENMRNMERKFGLHMTLPIIADCKVGRHWGDSIELSTEQVYNFPGLDGLVKH